MRTLIAAVLSVFLAASAAAGTARDYQNAGNALVKLGKIPEAIKQYEQALRLAPKNPKLKAYVDQLKKNSSANPANTAPAAGQAGAAASGKGTVAVVFSEYSKAWLESKGKNVANVETAVKGAEFGLKKLGYATQRLSDKDVEAGKLMNYSLAVLPDSTAMSMKQQKALEAFNAAGKGIVMIWGYGAFDQDSFDQMDHAPLEKIFGVKFTGWQGDPAVGQGPFEQYFWYAKDDKTHPVGQGLPDRILMVTGEGNTVQLQGAKSVFQFMNKDKSTLVGGTAVAAHDNGKGRAVFIGSYLASQIGDTDPDTPQELEIRLFNNCLKWVSRQ